MANLFNELMNMYVVKDRGFEINYLTKIISFNGKTGNITMEELEKFIHKYPMDEFKVV